MTAHELLFQHKYEAAAAVYEAELKVKPNDSGALSGHARVLLCLGRFEEAIDEYRRANAIASAELKGESQPYLPVIGSILWLLDKRDEAIQTVTNAVNGVIDGTIKFGDNAGGVSQGVLLWYFGTSNKDKAVIDRATKYLIRLAKKSGVKYWPGPLALLLLRHTDEAIILNDHFNATSLADGVKIAETDLLKRRRLVQLLFYVGARERFEGYEEACIEAMRRCAQLENPIIENEWYLARHEVQKLS